MIRVKRSFLIFLLMIVLSETLSATTIFARQYDMKCGGCHIGVPPTLNTTGESFLRNGMRFSQSDTTTLQRFLSKENSITPLGLFAGVGTNNMSIEKVTKKGSVTMENSVVNPIFTPFLAGSINKNFSLFMGARFIYAKRSLQDERRELKIDRSKAYLQYNQGVEHLARAGVIYLYPETSQNSGLSNVADFYISPLDRGILKPLHGAEYSYEMQSMLTLSVAAGIVGDANYEQSAIAKLEYAYEGFKFGAILNSVRDTKSREEMINYRPSDVTFAERLSLMIPLEYEFSYGYINVTGLYEDNKKVVTGDYYGLESSITLPVFESGNVRYIHTRDNQEGYGNSFRYAHIIYEKLFLNANYAQVETPQGNYNSLIFGFNIIY